MYWRVCVAMYWLCIGYVLAMYWLCIGYALAMYCCILAVMSPKIDLFNSYITLIREDEKEL